MPQVVPAWALDAEADAFFCFSAIMAEMGDVRRQERKGWAAWETARLFAFCADSLIQSGFFLFHFSQVFTKNLDMHNTGLLGALDHMNG